MQATTELWWTIWASPISARWCRHASLRHIFVSEASADLLETLRVHDSSGMAHVQEGWQ